jgi:hypothetical protein
MYCVSCEVRTEFIYVNVEEKLTASVVCEFLATEPEVWVRFPALPDFLERGPFSLVSTTEGLLGRNSSGSGLENLDYCRRGTATLTTRHPSIRKI